MTIELHISPMTAEEFDTWVLLPENSEGLFEFVTGKIVEKSLNFYASVVSAHLTGQIGIYLLQNRIGFLTSAKGGYVIMGERYIPSAAFMSYIRQSKASFEVYNSTAPDLAVEVISNPKNPKEQETLRRKVTAYLAAGTTVWVFDINDKFIEVHAPGKAPKIYKINDTLDGGDILPGFSVPLKDLFPLEEETQA